MRGPIPMPKPAGIPIARPVSPPAARSLPRTLTLQYTEPARKEGCSTFAVAIHYPVKAEAGYTHRGDFATPRPRKSGVPNCWLSGKPLLKAREVAHAESRPGKQRGKEASVGAIAVFVNCRL